MLFADSVFFHSSYEDMDTGDFVGISVVRSTAVTLAPVAEDLWATQLQNLTSGLPPVPLDPG